MVWVEKIIISAGTLIVVGLLVGITSTFFMMGDLRKQYEIDMQQCLDKHPGKLYKCHLLVDPDVTVIP